MIFNYVECKLVFRDSISIELKNVILFHWLIKSSSHLGRNTHVLLKGYPTNNTILKLTKNT